MTPAETAPPLLRLEVARLRAGTSRARFATVLHAGVLGGRVARAEVPTWDPVLDAGTRVEVVSSLLDAAVVAGDHGACVWLSRMGECVVQDEDLAWLAASRLALGALGRPLAGFWAITRTGWLDVRTGDRRTWKRLRA